MGISYTTFSKTHKSSVCSISSSSANPPSAQKALGVILCVKLHARAETASVRPQAAWGSAGKPGGRRAKCGPRRRARQKQQLHREQTNPFGGGARAPLPWQPSRAGDGRRTQPKGGNPWAAAARTGAESRALGPWAVRGGGGASPKPRPRREGPAPSRRRFFGGSAFPPPANPERRLPALSGLNCPPAGKGLEGGWGGELSHGGRGARGGHVEPEGSGINSRQHGSSRRGRRSSNMASGARGQTNRAG